MEKTHMGANKETTLEGLHLWKPQSRGKDCRLQADCGMQRDKAHEILGNFGKIYEKLQQEHLTKEEALQLRAELEGSM